MFLSFLRRPVSNLTVLSIMFMIILLSVLWLSLFATSYCVSSSLSDVLTVLRKLANSFATAYPPLLADL